MERLCTAERNQRKFYSHSPPSSNQQEGIVAGGTREAIRNKIHLSKCSASAARETSAEGKPATDGLQVHAAAHRTPGPTRGITRGDEVRRQVAALNLVNHNPRVFGRRGLRARRINRLGGGHVRLPLIHAGPRERFPVCSLFSNQSFEFRA
jgi:hypothetical protein